MQIVGSVTGGKTKFTASVISLSQAKPSDIYLTLKMRMFEAEKANLNGVAVTEGFIDEIVNNSQDYVCIPLCADVDTLTAGAYDKLGHCYDAQTGTFDTQQIGGFCAFEKEHNTEGVALVGTARVMKRNAQVCDALKEMFASGNLHFSFEVSCADWQVLENGTVQIGASEHNKLEGMCVVSNPAYRCAKALQLVAESGNLQPMKDKEVKQNMPEVQETNVQVAETSEETAKEEEVVAETKKEEEKKEEENVEEAECKQEEDEEKKKKPFESSAELENNNVAEDTHNDFDGDMNALLAEINHKIAELQTQFAELKESASKENINKNIDEKMNAVMAEYKENKNLEAPAQMPNPFLSEMTTGSGETYGLLGRTDASFEPAGNKRYSLLDRY